MRIPAILLASLVLAASAQSPVATPVAPLYHPNGPLPSYEVATIKVADPDAANGVRRMAAGPSGPMGQAIKAYILNAYGASSVSHSQIVGGPAWIDTDRYVIQGKEPDDQREAMKTMSQDQKRNLTLGMQQSLLADRFKLKVHFEVRELPVFELTAAKGGLKIKEVPAFVPGTTPMDLPKGPMPMNAPPRPGITMMMINKNGDQTVKAGATTLPRFINMLRANSELGGKPVLDKTGFTGSFDANLTWAGPTTTSDISDAPNLFAALEETFGLKLTSTKGPVEVIVIDSIERPSEN